MGVFGIRQFTQSRSFSRGRSKASKRTRDSPSNCPIPTRRKFVASLNLNGSEFNRGVMDVESESREYFHIQFGYLAEAPLSVDEITRTVLLQAQAMCSTHTLIASSFSPLTQLLLSPTAMCSGRPFSAQFTKCIS